MEITINYWAVFVVALINMIIGFIWYGPLFGKLWKELMGFTEETMKEMKMSPIGAMIGGFIGAFIMAYILKHFVVSSGAFWNVGGAFAGVTVAFWIWFGFIAPVTAGSFLWEGKPFKIWVLNSSYWLVTLIFMGAILGIWA